LAHSIDVIAAVAGGAVMTLLVLFVTALPADSRLSPYFAETSYLLAHGHNVVNVILVDYRGFDTMGEITVLGLAAIGVFGLLILRLEKSKLTVAPPERLARTRTATDVYPVVEKEKAL
jgi:multicomponent Na+:H+ antiporter subunit A